MNSKIYYLAIYPSVFSPLIPLICLLIYRRQPRQNFILAISLIISLTFDILSIILNYYKKSPTPYVNVYFIIAFPVIMWFYHETLIKQSLKITIRIFSVVFLLLSVILTGVYGIKEINFALWTLSSMLISAASFFFVADLNQMDESPFTKNPHHEANIILNTSLALYYFVTVIFFAISDYALSTLKPEDWFYFWAFHNLIHVLKNIGVTVAFYLTAKQTYLLDKSLASKQASQSK